MRKGRILRLRSVSLRSAQDAFAPKLKRAQLAQRTFPILRLARMRKSDTLLQDEAVEMARDWGNFAAYLEDLATRYAGAYVSGS